MTKNPYLNAGSALAYISLVALMMNYATKYASSRPDKLLDPIAFLSLFSLSAAVMAFLFFYQPVQLYFDGKKKQALDLFLKTLGSFAVITLILLVVVFSGII